MKHGILLFILMLFFSTAFPAAYYISPSGADSRTGTSESLAWKTFARAFSAMSAGDELILLDGAYSAAAGTGYINWDDNCATCGQPPSGNSLSVMTVVRAKNPGSVVVDGGIRQGLFLGRSARKDSCIRIQGITFEGGGQFWNTRRISVKECGFHSASMAQYGVVFTLGVSDQSHTNGNTDNLIEDCWIWGQERIIASNYNSDRNVWRRVVIRGDGCNSPSCLGSGNPNVGFTVYDSRDCSIQNMMVVDRVLGGGEPFGSFATAQHTPGNHLLGPNEWLGCIALNSEDGGFVFGADEANDRTHTLRNIIAWNCSENIDIPHVALNVLLENITVGNSRDADNLRLDPSVTTGLLRNILSYRGARYGINSPIAPAYSCVYQAGSANYNQSSCTAGCLTLNPLTSGLKHLVRIEEGSALKGSAYNGADYGANVVHRYGADGARYGEINSNALTAVKLWPWPNEERIKSDFSKAGTRGFCAAGQTLTRYVWEYLGNSIPADIYPPGQGGTTSAAPAAAAAGFRILGSALNRGAVNPAYGESFQIHYQLASAGDVECRVFTLAGKQVWVSTQQNVRSGTFVWKPGDAAAGTYWVSLKGPGIDARKKAVVVR